MDFVEAYLFHEHIPNTDSVCTGTNQLKLVQRTAAVRL